jgi:hypothetical protein
MRRLKENKERVTSQQAGLILQMAEVYHVDRQMLIQISSDLSIYPLWDAAALWSNPDGGLIQYNEEAIVQLMEWMLKFFKR